MEVMLCTSDICVAVLPLAPSITMARAEEMLNGEKKTFSVLSLSPRLANRAREKVLLALVRGADEAMVPAGTKNRALIVVLQL